MDFITLATTETDIRQWLRRLDEMLMDNHDNSDPIHPGDAASTIYSYMQEEQQQQLLLQQQQLSGGMTSGEGRLPVISKSAEAELYLLATNFLLYVAMVIITTMVAKIYFPELLQRDTSRATASTYNYRVAEGQDQEDFYASDDDHENDLEEEQELLDSEGEEDPIENEGAEVQSSHRRERHTSSTHTTTSFWDFHAESMTKAQVLRRLVFCSIMLNVTFVTWGVLQERMLTRRYPRYTGEYFTYSYALVFTNRFWTFIMSGMLLLYLKPRPSRSTVIYEYSFPSISNMLSSWCQYEALRYISFPATTLFKSFKLAPVMAMGKILGNKSYPQYDYIVALLIGVGIAMFMTSTDDLQIGQDYLGDKSSTTWTGVMLLFLFLLFDSFTSQFQSRMFQRHRDLSMVELMFATSAFSTVLSLVTLIHTKELYPALSFVKTHSEIHLHFFLFSICSTIGQLFIFYTIKNFGAVVFTLIMTTRILLSIALSCIMYGHPVSATGFFGLMIVMGAVLYRIRRKAQGQQLLKWQGMEDSTKAHELVQEWHEHVDM